MVTCYVLIRWSIDWIYLPFINATVVLSWSTTGSSSTVLILIPGSTLILAPMIRFIHSFLKYRRSRMDSRHIFKTSPGISYRMSKISGKTYFRTHWRIHPRGTSRASKFIYRCNSFHHISEFLILYTIFTIYYYPVTLSMQRMQSWHNRATQRRI